MRIRAPRSVSLRAGLALSAVALTVNSGCGSQKVAREGTDVVSDRARQVAEAWDGSTAAAEWRAGYYPLGAAVQLPRGGLRSQADKQAYEDRHFFLRGKLPDFEQEDGQVTWSGGASLTRPLMRVKDAYKILTGDGISGEPHLTVTGTQLGEMKLATSRGPATVPAWIFKLDGYDSPLKQAAAVPSKLPRPPIGAAHDIPGHPLNRLVQIATDGHSVTVVALHGVCDDGAAVDVLETSGSVVLSASVKDHKDRSKCTKQAKMQQMTVELERPLGDRVLLDARTGQPVPYKGPLGT
ncbi:hypothetical protein [Streptomyces sp. NBC_00649]|uniref:hypothetical protein n=1 Tax=Streptomyces sp. NBC_00649 TaxID=2975798 RepID=UPI00324DABC8